jgi:integrase
MPSGACVIPYEGKRGVVWRIKYRDADGHQVQETVGAEREGWSRQKAERELGKRLDAVEKGMRKITRRTFNDLADEFERITLEAKPRKRSTLIDYRATLNNHLRVWFGHEDLERLSRSPELIEHYAARKLTKGLAPKTVRNHLALLGLMFKQARKWRWVSENPLELVDPPPLDDVEAETLTAAEVSRLLAAYVDLAVGEDSYWFDVARRMTVVALSTGLRRGELLGLRWQDVELLDKRLHVRQAFVRGEMTTPKSRGGRRTVTLGGHAIGSLEEQFRSTNYRAPECSVFCHEALGTPLDPSKLTRFARKAFKAAAIEKPFRPWHGLRHTALTETAAAGVPAMFVQAKAGHAQGSTTERYLHASKTSYPDAAELAEARRFTAAGTRSGTNELPGLDSNQQPSG